MSCKKIEDAGTQDELRPIRGIEGEVVPCSRLHSKNHGDDCSMCGGRGVRRVCGQTQCYEHGCQGHYCYVPHDGFYEKVAKKLFG